MEKIDIVLALLLYSEQILVGLLLVNIDDLHLEAFYFWDQPTKDKTIQSLLLFLCPFSFTLYWIVRGVRKSIEHWNSLPSV